MKLEIIGVPFDLESYETGKGLAPAALLAAGLRERLETAGVQVAEVVAIAGPIAGATREARLGIMLHSLASAVARTRVRGNLPLIIGGDCLTALGTLAGLHDWQHTTVAWIDAHGDFNTPATTVSGYLGGMPLACAVGRGLDTLRRAATLSEPLIERNIVLLGVRDLDPAEAALLQESELTIMSAADVTRRAGDIAGAIKLLGSGAQLYVHLDIDVLHNAVAPGVDYPAPGGLTLPMLSELLAPIARLPNLAAIALTAVNPERDIDGRTVNAAIAALETIVSAAISS